MIDLKFLREHPTEVEKNANNKGVKLDVTSLLKLEEEARLLDAEVQKLQHEQNQESKTIPSLHGEEKGEKLQVLKALSEQLRAKQSVVEKKKTLVTQALLKIPNLLRPDVLIGKDDSENKVLRTEGEPPQFSFHPKDYLTLAKQHHLLDLDGPSRSSGTRFGALLNEAAMLEFALVRWVFDTLKPQGFIPVVPPVLIRHSAMQAMGYVEQGGEEEIYHLPHDDLDLVGTSEQSIGPIHQNEILAFENLPLRYAAFSTCFRREAGSYGRDTKGIIRVHQFDKIEMFSFTSADRSDAEHEFFLSLQEEFLKHLKLPYHVLSICSGDTGFPVARKWDLETWIPSENKYRETHSTSTCTDFQARRLNIRCKNPTTKKTEFVHTVNGTAFAIGRILIAIFEHYQQADGSIRIPNVLQPYTGFTEIR